MTCCNPFNFLKCEIERLKSLFSSYVCTYEELINLNATGSQIIVNCGITLQADTVITSPLKILKGGYIRTGAYVLTINGPFDADSFRVFYTSSGHVVFGDGTVFSILPEWFGALGDGSTNDAVALQMSLDSGGNNSIIKLTAGKVYVTSSTITIPITRDNQTIVGYGATLKGNVNGNILKISDTSTNNDHCTNINIFGLEILGSGDTDTTYPLQNGIEIDAIIGCILRDVIIREIPQTGIVGTKSTASGSTYWNKVIFENTWVRFCGKQTLYIGTGSAVDDLTMINCLLNHGGSQISTNFADGSAYIKAISLTMSGCEISGNYSITTSGAGYRWGLLIQSASGIIQGCHFEINGNDQAGSADLLLDTQVKGISVIGCGFYGSSTQAPKFAFQDTGTGNVFDAISWTSDVSHAYDYIAEIGSSTDCYIGNITSLNSPVVGPNIAIINPSTTTIIRRRVEKGTTPNRPIPLYMEYGRMYLDTTLDVDGLPIFWQGSKWIKADGTDA